MVTIITFDMEMGEDMSVKAVRAKVTKTEKLNLLVV